MKKLSLLITVILSLGIIYCNGQNTGTTASSDEKASKIEVIDFHSTHRCKTCNAIETNTIYTLETYFPEEMKNGTITFQTINVDKDENYDVARKYNVTGTSLFLNVIIDGKSKKINLTNFAFMNGNDKETFSAKLKEKLEKQMNKL